MSDTNAVDPQQMLARAADLTVELADLGPRAGADVGDPRISGLELYSSNGYRVGVWQSTPGGWSIEDRQGTETMVILGGRVRLSAEGAEPVEICAGDVFVLPHGWTGRWETLETVRKIYIYVV